MKIYNNKVFTSVEERLIYQFVTLVGLAMIFYAGVFKIVFASALFTVFATLLIASGLFQIGRIDKKHNDREVYKNSLSMLDADLREADGHLKLLISENLQQSTEKSKNACWVQKIDWLFGVKQNNKRALNNRFSEMQFLPFKDYYIDNISKYADSTEFEILHAAIKQIDSFNRNPNKIVYAATECIDVLSKALKLIEKRQR